MDGSYQEHFSNLDEQAYSRLEKIMAQMKKQNSPPKTDSFTEMAKYNNHLHTTAEEIVLSELIYI